MIPRPPFSKLICRWKRPLQTSVKFVRYGQKTDILLRVFEIKHMWQALGVYFVLWSALVSMIGLSCITCAWGNSWLQNSKVNIVLIKTSCRQCSVRVRIYWWTRVSWYFQSGLGCCIIENVQMLWFAVQYADIVFWIQQAVVCNSQKPAGAFRISRENLLLAPSCLSAHLHVRLSFCLSSIITVAPAGRIFVKCDFVDFYENLWRNSKYIWNLTEISGILHECLIGLCCGQYYKILCGSTTVSVERIVAIPFQTEHVYVIYSYA